MALRVWVVELGAYEAQFVAGVFSTAEKAQAFIDHVLAADPAEAVTISPYTLDEEWDLTWG